MAFGFMGFGFVAFGFNGFGSMVQGAVVFGMVGFGFVDLGLWIWHGGVWLNIFGSSCVWLGWLFLYGFQLKGFDIIGFG